MKGKIRIIFEDKVFHTPFFGVYRDLSFGKERDLL